MIFRSGGASAAWVEPVSHCPPSGAGSGGGAIVHAAAHKSERHDSALALEPDEAPGRGISVYCSRVRAASLATMYSVWEPALRTMK